MKTIINFKGVDLQIDYDYTPAEQQVLDYGDGSGYPGYPEFVEINEITHKGEDVSLLVENDMNEIGNLILENL